MLDLKRVVSLCSVAVLLVTSPLFVPRAHAWGSEGHRLTGLIAESQLTPQARARLREIIPGADLAELSVFMDVYREALKREVPGSDKWHYDNRPVCRESTPAQYCPDDNCAGAKIPFFVAQIADAKASNETRAQAIKFVLHMVADTHQPLHVADDDDWGGNKKMAQLRGAEMPRNLHFIWDIEFVKLAMAGKPEVELARDWVARFAREIPQWSQGDNPQWMRETEKFGRDFTYGALSGFSCGTRVQDGQTLRAALFDGQPWGDTPRTLDDRYVRRAVSDVPQMLTKAGVRVAAILNRTLDPRPKPEPTTARADK